MDDFSSNANPKEIRLDATDLTTAEWRKEWSFPDGVIYLNHGSFGPSPRVVRAERQMWSDRLEDQPMDFFLRHMEERLDDAYEKLAAFLTASANDLLFVDNATAGMNIAAENTELKQGDEVLLTNHEYGAVMRIWRRACQRVGATVVVQPLPTAFESEDEVVEAFLRGVTPRTRLIVVSHVTSPTAVVLPVETICRRARELGVPVCIDGPHAIAMLPVDFTKLDCDFYTASCHKWLSAPFGSGFLRVSPRRQQNLQPPVMSWGGSLSGRKAIWKDEFTWKGTYDPAAYLAIPRAIEFLDRVGWDTFRRRTHELARYARRRIVELTELEPHVPDNLDWYGSMISLPLPPSGRPAPKHGRRDALQNALWEQYRIEIPIVHWHGERFIRISCHLYNTRDDVDRLVDALRNFL